MREHLIGIARSRSLTSSSLILSRAFPITKGITLQNIERRLKRLHYHPISDPSPEVGEYHLSEKQLLIALRELPGEKSLSLNNLAKLALENSKVKEIQLNGKIVSEVMLEPEQISYLGGANDTTGSNRRISTPLGLAAFPTTLKSAILAIEDERFYYHFGIDPQALLRAVIVNITNHKLMQGGSTLTQQLAKNLLLSNERTISRKLYEVLSALLIETAFSKDQILEMYLNEVFLGQDGSVAIHGFGEASKSFFGKEASDLSLPESALLAGIIKAPTSYSPRRHPDRAKDRRDIVLYKMREQGMVSQSELDSALTTPISTQPALSSRRLAPHFVDFIRQSSGLEHFITESSGENPLQVVTTLDREYQDCAESAVRTELSKLERTFSRLKRKDSPLEAALVSADLSSGEIRAWVGGRNYLKSQFDRVNQAERQPGSSFKPFVYLTALDSSLNQYRVARTTSLLDDKPLTIEIPGSGEWSPENYDHDYRGEVTLREALTHSLNIPTVNLAMKVGVEAIQNTAKLFGINKNLPPGPAIALGAGEVTPFELIHAYATLANGGVKLPLPAISALVMNEQKVYQRSPKAEDERVASEGAVFVLNSILQSVVENGTGNGVRKLGYEKPVAGKTGTSNDARDAWFAGFTPHLVTVAWVGFDDNSKLGLTGGQAAVPIWTTYMNCVKEMEPDLKFIPSAEVVTVKIDKATGLLANSACGEENFINEVFVKGTEPVTSCTDVPEEEGIFAPSISANPPTNPTPQKHLWNDLFD